MADDKFIFQRAPDVPARDAPRAAHEAYAKKHNFFWLPCPACGELFGGHEAARGGRFWESPSSGQMTCPKCPGEYNTHLRDGLPPPIVS